MVSRACLYFRERQQPEIVGILLVAASKTGRSSLYRLQGSQQMSVQRETAGTTGFGE